MTCLVLRLAGPLQAWGTGSRFAYRNTDTQPSRSAVLGLLASAQGRRRSEPIEDLLALRFGVRCDQPGALVRDFQTARALDESFSLPLTYRFYLGDAVFVAVLEGDEALVDGLSSALRRPSFPLYLGRRSCPPAQPLLIGVQDGSLRDVLCSTDSPTGVSWQASEWYRQTQSAKVALEVVRDASPNERAHAQVADVPVSFDPHQRRYSQREVVRETVQVDNPDAERRRPLARLARTTDHAPFALTEEP